MSHPLYLPCYSVADIPTVEQIHGLVSHERHLVLEFPRPGDQLSAFPLPEVLERLRQQLPDFSVFSPGARGDAERITIIRVVSREAVLERADEIIAAARLFQRTARELIYRLAEKLQVPPSAFWERFYRLELQPGHDTGSLDREWSYWFHGLECQFSNRRTGQTLDVILGVEDEFGVLDPFFFARFVKSTLGLELVANLINDDFHDPRRMFDVLEEVGMLRRVERRLVTGTALIPADP